MGTRQSGRPDPTGGGWAGTLVYCAGSSWDATRGTDRQLVERLRHHVPVLWVDPPESVLTPLRRRDPGALRRPRLQVVAPGLARLTPLAPPGVSRPGLRRLATLASRRALRGAVRRLGATVDTVVVASLDDLFGVCGERHRVLFATDDFVAAGELMGLSPAWLRHEELARRSELTQVVAVSEPLARHWRAAGVPTTVVPNGCDVAAYAEVDRAPVPADVTLPGPVVGFVGQLSRRIDVRHLEAVADTGASLLLVGPVQATLPPEHLAALLARPCVQWVGPRSYDELPGYLRLVAVGVTPYTDTAFNRGSFPLKTLEYLAAGRAAVSTDLPAARWLDTDLVSIRAEPAAFAAEVVRLLAEDDPDLPGRRRAFAARHSWEVRARAFLAVVGVEGGQDETSAR